MVNPRPGHGRKKDETVYIEIPGTGPPETKTVFAATKRITLQEDVNCPCRSVPDRGKQGAKGNRSFYENPLPKQNRVIGEQGNSQKPDFPYLNGFWCH